MRLQQIFGFLLLLSLALTSELQSQTRDGVYSDGTVILALEHFEESVEGYFISHDKQEFEVSFVYMDRGIAGILGGYNAFIPYGTENVMLSITPFDSNNQAIWDQSEEYELVYISDLDGNSPDQVQEQEYYEYSWNPIHRFGTDFYPSYILATSTMTYETSFEQEDANYSFYGDANGFFGVSISGLAPGTIVTIVVEGQPLIKQSAYEATITQSGTSEIYPVIEYDFDGLKNVIQAKPLNIKYSVYIDGEYAGEKLEIVWTRSVNDAVTYALDHHGNDFPMSFIFAAYVNENEPNLDPILGKALDEGIVQQWIGYQGTETDVIEQVFALWYHFQNRGFRYSSITTQSGSDDRSFGQVVRFVKDALVTTQANCIDGTVLFASFLYKIGIDVSIVLVPGHAYLAFIGDKEGTTKYALETTMIGQLSLERSAKQNEFYLGLAEQDEAIKDSYDSFLGALNVGTENYFTNALPGIQQQAPQYLEINIKEARIGKIRPIK